MRERKRDKEQATRVEKKKAKEAAATAAAEVAKDAPKKKRGRPKGEAQIKPTIPSSHPDSEHLLVEDRHSGDTAPESLPEFRRKIYDDLRDFRHVYAENIPDTADIVLWMSTAATIEKLLGTLKDQYTGTIRPGFEKPWGKPANDCSVLVVVVTDGPPLGNSGKSFIVPWSPSAR